MARLASLIVFSFIFAAAALAQGSGHIGGGAHVMTKDLRGTIKEIDRAAGFVIIEVEPEKNYRFRLDKKVRLKADKKTALAESKKKIELTDFDKGHFIRVTYRTDQPDNAVELRMLKPKEPSQTAAGSGSE